MKLFRRKGQSTLEYLIILAVVIAVIITVATTVFRTNIENIMNRVTKKPGAMVTSNMLPL